MYKRILAVVLCAALVVSVLPVLSFSASADNSGFCQIRVFYKVKDTNGNWSAEKSAIITDNSSISIPTRNMAVPLQITRFLIRNDSDSTCYFQFDINFGGLIPNSGTFPTATYSSILFTTNGGVTAYSFDTTDKSNLVLWANNTSGGAIPYVYSSAASRTFFGKVDSTGYLTFNNPVNVTYRPNDSVADSMVMFFRHVIIGLDNSSYLANMEQYLSNLDSNVSSIADWMEEEHEQYQSAWYNGAGSAYDDYASDNGTFFGNLLGILGLRIFSWHWDLNIFNASNNFFSSWFSQNNSDNINGAPRRSPEEETEYVDYYFRNQNGDLDIFGVDNDD